MTKMGRMGLMAGNLAAAQGSIKPLSSPWARLQAGRGMIWAGGHAAKGLDTLAGKAVSGVLGGGGALAGTAAGIGDVAMSPLRGTVASKALAFGLPLGLVFETQNSDQLRPLFNDAIQEGRSVYANDNEFLAKKLAETTKKEKTAGPVNMPQMGSGFPAGFMPDPGSVRFNYSLSPSVKNWQEGMASAGESMKSPFVQGLGNMLASKPGGGGMLAGGMIGGLSRGVGDVIGTTKEIFNPFMGTTGYRMNRALNPVMTRVKADELFAQNFVSTMGSEIAKTLSGLLKDVASKAVSTVQNLPAQRSMLQIMQQDDPILSSADPEQLASAYHTMAKFAPTLATDENAVRSFLRQAAQAGSGVDFVTIKAVADTEKAVSPQTR